jgi:ABC-2 type transport system ATP-binding protein
MSNVDNEAIAFTVFEPTTFVDGQTYPLVLHSHGYGGSRQATLPANGLLRDLLDNGFGIISIDERGHNDSGGTIRILDHDFEVQDLLQILDWAETNLQWLAYDASATPDTGFGKGNPIIGAVGGSYGGGYQHLIYALDPLHRLDAIAPDITWHDLRFSLFSSDVFKSFWATALSGVGNRLPNRQDQQVNQGLIEGLSMNTLSQANQDLLYRNSLRSHCEEMNDSTAPGGLTPLHGPPTDAGVPFPVNP